MSNASGDNEGEDPEATKDEAWKILLEEDGMLKSWSAVTLLKGSKVNLGYAMREYMRQAWGKLFFL